MRCPSPTPHAAGTASGLLDRAVIVAVSAVRMMQVAVDQIVHMVPMRYRFVTTSGPMLVICVMTGATMLWSALVGIGRGDLDDVFVNVVLMHVMEMPLV